MLKRLMYNTKELALFILRRDRVRLPIWILSITIFTLVLAAAYPGLFPTVEERQALALMMENPAVIFMLGPSTGLNKYTYGAMFGHEMLVFSAIAVGIMNIMLFTRHTRSDEEEGRIEVIRSLPVGRLANISATTIILVAANILLGLLIGFGLALLNIESMGVNGSLLYGMSLGVIGILFAGITAIFAQLTESARGTIGYSFLLLIGLYLIRGIGDVSSEVLSWFSPLTWIVKTEVYVNNVWWPIPLILLVSIILISFAFYLNAIRDLEAGFIPSKPGRSEAPKSLNSTLGLGYRILRVTIISWITGLFVIGVAYGSVFGEMDTFLNNSILADILPDVEGYSKDVLFLTFLNVIMAMLCTIPSLLIIQRIKVEEKKARIQHLLSRPISRNTIISSYLFLSVLVGVIALLLSGIGLYASIVAVMDNPIPLNLIISSIFVYIVAIIFMISISVMIVGTYPKASNIIWLYLGYTFFSVYLGELLQFPEIMSKLTPFGYMPQLPIDKVNYLTLIIITIISIGFIIIGYIGYNKRDING